MDLSVIIVNWNSGRFLEKCLNSVYKAIRGIRFEVFIVDNASSDQSLACLKKFHNVMLIKNKQNLGFAKANNQAIKKSRGRYVLLLNPDTIIMKGSIKRVLSYMDKNLGIGVLGYRLLNTDKTVQPSCHAFLTLPHVFFEVSQLDILFPKNSFFIKIFGHLNRIFPKIFLNYLIPDEPIKVDSVMGSCYMIRRKALEKTGLLDEDFFLYHEEMELSYRMWQEGCKVVFYPHASVTHYGKHSTEQVPDLVYYERCRSILHFFKKHKNNQFAILKMVIFISLLINFFSLPFRKDFKNALNYRLKVLRLLR